MGGGREARSEASPLDERLSLEQIIAGLASDLQAVRDGRMTVDAARAQAEIARQLFNGVRLVVAAQKYIDMRPLPTPTERRPNPNPDESSD